MKRPHVRLVAATALIGLVLIAATGTSAAADPLLGHWTAPDTFDNDGSTTHMILSPGPDGTYRLRAWDNPSTSGCPVIHGLGTLEGTAIFDASTDTLTKTVVAKCPSEGTSGSPASHMMYYDPSKGTITDPDFNLVYSK